MLDEDRYFGLVVWYDEASRSDPETINETILEPPSGRRVALGQVAEVLDTTGPNTLQIEGEGDQALLQRYGLAELMQEADHASARRFILSKGHGCPTLYATLAHFGYFERSLFSGFRQLGSRSRMGCSRWPTAQRSWEEAGLGS